MGVFLLTLIAMPVRARAQDSAATAGDSATGIPYDSAAIAREMDSVQRAGQAWERGRLHRDSLEAVSQAKAARRSAEMWRLQAAERQAKMAKWPARMRTLVQHHKLAIGMSAEMVVESWGEPRDKHRTITATHVSEQWVYGDADQLVYLDDGIVTAIQD